MEYYIWNYRHKKYALYQNWCLAFWNTLRSKIQIVTYPLNQIWKTYFFHNTKAIGSKHFGLLSDYRTCTFLFFLILNFSPTSRGLLMFLPTTPPTPTPPHTHTHFCFYFYHAVILICIWAINMQVLRMPMIALLMDKVHNFFFSFLCVH